MKKMELLIKYLKTKDIKLRVCLDVDIDQRMCVSFALGSIKLLIDSS